MKNQVLVKRYAQGLAKALTDDEDYRRISGELKNFLGLMKSEEGPIRVLSNPLINSRKKAQIIETILDRTDFLKKTKRFLMLLAEHGRLELLGDIMAAVPEAWDHRRGVLTFDVASVVPLAEEQKDRLMNELKRLENKPVSLSYRIDPTIIGGLSLRKGHIIYDASVEGDLLRLKEKIQEG